MNNKQLSNQKKASYVKGYSEGYLSIAGSYYRNEFEKAKLELDASSPPLAKFSTSFINGMYGTYGVVTLLTDKGISVYVTTDEAKAIKTSSKKHVELVYTSSSSTFTKQSMTPSSKDATQVSRTWPVKVGQLVFVTWSEYDKNGNALIKDLYLYPKVYTNLDKLK